MPRLFHPVYRALTPSPDVLSALRAARDSSSSILRIRDASRLSVEIFEGTRGHNLDDKISTRLSLPAGLCFAMKIRSRTRLGRLIKQVSDLAKIKDYREDLHRFVGVFNLATIISILRDLEMRQDQQAERDVPRSNQASASMPPVSSTNPFRQYQHLSVAPLQMNLSITNVNGNQYNYSDSLVNSNNAMNIVHGLTSSSPVAVVGSA
ncbi:hypothetical protein LshimejAT787_0703030 [Lyophyllum shimeji]|uniref:Uncharacterized protein n=1 Tax=Lyophyllum shimeji TaxID=47721 RepID=A0A9P3PPQ3_LYOSH|nr:hypothetical protein LshimejAT787_0703030 [Lyophyllum shimeji]